LARKILLADDSVTAQNMGRKILTDAGYEVITVNNGSAALKKIAEGKPDLIVLDVYMPGYSGLEVCQRIKENRETSRIPILLTVGKLEPFKPEEARRAKADAFVVKPFEASELLSALTKLEDKIIPGAEPYKPGRFAKAIASVERGEDPSQFRDTDEGWKARLRIPTGQPKETEPPVDYAATQGKGFRDSVEPQVRKAATPTFERPIPSGLPHDITPEEIAAITAAAEQLKGARAAGPESVAVAEPAVEPEEMAPEAALCPAEASVEDAAPVTFASAPEVEDGFSSEPVSAGAPDSVPAADPSVDTILTEVPHSESLVVAETPTVVEEATSAAEISATEEMSPVMLEQSPVDSPATPAEIPAPEPAELASKEAAESTPMPSPPIAQESPAEQTTTPVETPVAESASAVAPEIPATAASAGPAPAPAGPADDEVMAALHALIPTEANSGPDGSATAAVGSVEVASSAATVPADAPTTPESESGPRWIAEEVALSAEETALALDREMEMATLAAQTEPEPASATEAAAAVANDQPPVGAVAEVPQSIGAEAPQVQALATAAGAEFPAPWPIANSPAAAETPSIDVRSDVAERLSPATAPASDPREELHPTTESLGGTEDMAASWKNIRDSIAASAAKPAPAKEEFTETAVPDAEATVAGTHHSESAQSPEAAGKGAAANDPTAIANIVESVLAELRPKIVEEIARKLSDPKK